MRYAPALALPFAALLLTGCGASYSAPKLRVTNATVTERTDAGVVLNITVEADNANEEALPLREVRYDVFVGDRKVFSGNRSPEATLRRFGTQQVTLPAVIALAPGESAPAGSANYRIQGTLVYVTPGSIAEILFENDIRKPTISFSDGGQVDLSATPTPKPARGI